MAQPQNMIKYIVKRVLLMIPMLILVLIISWILSQLMFIDPVLNKMGMLDFEIIEAERIRIGFYDPWYVKLGLYLKNFFTGNWGTSYLVSDGEPVSQLIGKIFPKTIELVIIPIIVIPLIGIKLGVTSAKDKDKPKDTVIRGVAILGTALPIFWLATMLQYFVGHYLSLYTFGELNLEIMNPNSVTFRYPNPEWPFSTGFRLIDSLLFNDQALLQDTLIHLILPMLCMTFVSLAGITRQTRASMLDVLEQDYIRTARAKGSLEKDVINKHALRNALIPTSNLIVGGTAARLTGALFLEIAFNYTGMGFYMVVAIRLGDYVVINGILVFTVIIILSGVLIADVLYTIIDPRIVYK
ncbi:MAG: ABC transporter permease [Candidatus Lokiarchaeota archaeon]|nr:ABC transporter permease [Candidatus Lokiarchaeota archaeon]